MARLHGALSGVVGRKGTHTHTPTCIYTLPPLLQLSLLLQGRHTILAESFAMAMRLSQKTGQVDMLHVAVICTTLAVYSQDLTNQHDHFISFHPIPAVYVCTCTGAFIYVCVREMPMARKNVGPRKISSCVGNVNSWGASAKVNSGLQSHVPGLRRQDTAIKQKACSVPRSFECLLPIVKSELLISL